MGAQQIPEGYARRTEKIGGYTVALTSYRLGDRCFAKAEIDIPGAGARIAEAEANDQKAAEEKALEEARRAIEKR